MAGVKISHLPTNKNAKITYSILALIFLWVILPIPRIHYFPAVSAPLKEQILYVPSDSFIEKIYVKRGQTISKGDSIIDLDSIVLDIDIETEKLEQKIAEKEIEIFSLKQSKKDTSFIRCFESTLQEL